jgi:pimeloyl-ACP methyl ester carboxylesterase
VLWGAEDRLIPPVYARRWAEVVPGATVEILPQAGHMLPYERPEAFAEAVSRFLS